MIVYRIISKKIFFITGVFLAYLFMAKESAYAGTYDNAYTFYNQFSSSNLMQASNGYIYIGNRAGVASSSSTYLYNARGHRLTLTLNGIQYYIDLKRGLYGGIYDQNISDLTVGKYMYNLYRIPYQTICQLFQYNYPTINLAMLYQEGQNVQLGYDSIMTIKKRKSNGSYTLFGDLSYDHLGRPPAWGNIYFDQTTMEKAWKITTGQKKSFADFYHLQINIPGTEKGTFVTTTAIQVKDGPGIYKKEGNCYVKAGQLVEYSYSAHASFASATFQPNYIYLDLKDLRTNSYLSTWLYTYAPAGRTDGSICNHIPYRVSLESCILSRTDSNRCLNYKGMAKVVNDGERLLVTPRCAIFLNDVCQVVSTLGDSRLGVIVVSDGMAPVVQANQVGNVITIQANDAGSGLDYIKIYSEDGVERLKTSEREVSYPVTQNEVVRIVAADRVGNITESFVSATYEEAKETKAVYRFISKEFFNKEEIDGGLRAQSLWRNQADRKKMLEEALFADDFEEIIEWDEP